MRDSRGQPRVAAFLLGLCLLGWGNWALAAIAYVQGTYATQASASSATVNYSAAQSAGDLNVLIVGWIDTGSTTPSSISDSKGNTYTLAVGPTRYNNSDAQSIYYAKNIAAATAGSNTVTVTMGATVAYLDVRIAEYSGISTSSPLDVTAAATGTALTMSSGSATTTNANDLLVGGNYLAGGTTAAGTGYTLRLQTAYSSILEDEVVSSTGSYAATAPQDPTGAGWWIMQMAAFKAAAASPPSAPSSLTSTAPSAYQTSLGWSVSTGGVGTLTYRIERCAGASCSSFSQIASSTANSFSDTGLSGSTSYSYRVRAADSAGNISGYSGVSTVSTPAGGGNSVAYQYDTAGRLISATYGTGTQISTVYTLDAAGNRTSLTSGYPPLSPTALASTAASSTQINLTWTAANDSAGPGLAGYQVYRCSSTCTTYPTNFALVTTAASTSDSDTGLSPYTTYTYAIVAVDTGNRTSPASALASTRTLSAAPSAPGGLTATSISQSQINLAWNSSTDTGGPGLAGYTVYRCTSSCTSYPTNFTQIATPTATSYNDTGLTANTSYTYAVIARDTGGLTSTTSIVTSATSAAPPSQPTGLTATAASQTQINVSWTASTDSGGPGLAGYQIWRCAGSGCTNFAQVATATSASYSNTGLSGYTVYVYYVVAYDTHGATSSASATANATTPDQTAPTVPSGLTATAASYSQINLSWSASIDSGGSGLAGYYIFRNGTQIASTSSTSYSDTGLAASTLYTYTVESHDNAANRSAQSTQASATTQAPPWTTETATITEGSDDYNNNSLWGFYAPIGNNNDNGAGSISPTTFDSKYTWRKICDYKGPSSGGTLIIDGFTSNPGQAWLKQATITGGATLQGSAAGTFAYSNGEALWVWASNFGFANSGTVTLQIQHY